MTEDENTTLRRLRVASMQLELAMQTADDDKACWIQRHLDDVESTIWQYTTGG